jgi:hypothetical protein
MALLQAAHKSQRQPGPIDSAGSLALLKIAVGEDLAAVAGHGDGVLPLG